MAVGCPILTKVEAVGSSGLMQPLHADVPLLLGAGVGSCAVVTVVAHTKNEKRNSMIQCIILSQLREDKRIWVAWAIRAISLVVLPSVGCAFAAVLWRAVACYHTPWRVLGSGRAVCMCEYQSLVPRIPHCF
jgi:hypothetical protein